jgi:alanine dehydrogenase
VEELLYLSDSEIDGLRILPSRLRARLADAFRLHAAGRVMVDPKRMLTMGPGHFVQSMCAAIPNLGYAGHKWVGVAAANAAAGLPTVNSLVVLSEAATGRPAAILSANTLTVLRTAAMSALAAGHLARPDSRSIGFIGCGRQAHGHLAALLAILPDLRSAVCASGGSASADNLAIAARQAGLTATTTLDPDAALACDVVVTSVRADAGLVPFLDARKLQPGSFVAAVDVGASWRREGLDAFDIMATDDREQAQEPSTRARLALPRPPDADLADLVASGEHRRQDPEQRALFVFPGFALADIAVAIEILEIARAAGAGIKLSG